MDYFEFGPFQLEVASRTLSRDGEYVTITPKAVETLFVLVQESGRVVTKDELMQRVWPDAFVEEGSIANNISMLRKILNPHFDDDGPIVTVSRRGYRFTAPVALKSREAGIGIVADPGDDAVAVEKLVAGVAASTSSRRWTIPAAIAATLVVIAASGSVLTLRETNTEASATPPPRRAVAVLSMKNLSGKDEYAWFATALSEAINSDLGAGGQLRVVSGAAVAQIQQDLSTQPGVGLSRKQLDEIGKGLGCDLILTGNYLHTNGRIRVDVRLEDISTGTAIANFTVNEAENRLVDLVTTTGRELRSRIGLAPPLPGQLESARKALSSDPEALRFYFLGLDALRNHDIPRSVELLTQSIAEDPGFALAHSVLSISWRVLGHDDKSQAEAKIAFEQSKNLGREDQLAVQGAYYEVMSDWPKAVEKYQSLWSFFPDNPAYGLKLVHQQMLGGRLEEARRTLDQLRALPPPSNTDPRVDQVESQWYFRQARYADVVRVTRQGAVHARQRKSNQLLAGMLLMEGRAAARLGDPDRARSALADARQVYEGLGDHNGVGDAIRADAFVFAQLGQHDEAKLRYDEALAIATRINAQRLLPEVLVNRSESLRALHQMAAAKADATAALTAFRAAQNRSGIARALTALGAAESAEKDYVQARLHLDEAERVAREINEPLAIVDAVNALSALFEAQGSHDEARLIKLKGPVGLADRPAIASK